MINKEANKKTGHVIHARFSVMIQSMAHIGHDSSKDLSSSTRIDFQSFFEND